MKRGRKKTCDFSSVTIGEYSRKPWTEQSLPVCIAFSHWSRRNETGDKMSQINLALGAMTFVEKGDFISSYFINRLSEAERENMKEIFGSRSWTLDCRLGFAVMRDRTQFACLVEVVPPCRGISVDSEVLFVIEGSEKLVGVFIALIEDVYVSVLDPSGEWMTTYDRRIVLK